MPALPRLPLPSKLGLAAACIVMVIFGLVALLPLDDDWLDHVGVMYLVFLPVLVLFGAGVALSLVGILLAFRRRQSVIPAVVIAGINGISFGLMIRQIL